MRHLWDGSGRLSATTVNGTDMSSTPKIEDEMREKIISQPDVISEILSKDDEFLLLASDGLFDAITSQQAVNFVRRKIRKHGDVQVAAQELVNKALALLGHDNISVVVVCLNQFAAADDTT